jgi:hypothetical protein
LNVCISRSSAKSSSPNTVVSYPVHWCMSCLSGWLVCGDLLVSGRSRAGRTNFLTLKLFLFSLCLSHTNILFVLWRTLLTTIPTMLLILLYYSHQLVTLPFQTISSVSHPLNIFSIGIVLLYIISNSFSWHVHMHSSKIYFRSLPLNMYIYLYVLVSKYMLFRYLHASVCC